MPVRFFFSTNDWKLLSLPVSPINIGNRPFSLRFFTRMKSLFIICVVSIQYECQLHIPFSFHPASLQWGLMNFSFLCGWKVFLAGICYAIPLSYWSWFSDCPIGLHLLLFSFPHLSGLPYQIRLRLFAFSTIPDSLSKLNGWYINHRSRSGRPLSQRGWITVVDLGFYPSGYL